MKTGVLVLSVLTAALVVEYGITRARAATPRRTIPREIDEAALKRAFAQRESRNNPRARGKFGELGLYQFMPATWAMFSTQPFTDAIDDPAENNRVADCNLIYIRAELARRGLAISVAHIAAAWNYGPEFARVCANTEYVRAIVALYECEVSA